LERSTSERISTQIQIVHQDFLTENWCVLNQIDRRFDKNSYRVKVFQQFYLLKYFAAYFAEYYMAYSRFMSKHYKIFEGKTLKILSIGFGSGIDLSALSCVISDFNINIEIDYYGIDPIDWNYKPQTIPFNFTQKLMRELTAEEISDIDLFVFPKSLTDISNIDCEHFANLILESSNKEEIFFLNSFITKNSDSGNVSGSDNVKRIYQILSKDNVWKEEGDNLGKYMRLSNFDLSLRKAVPQCFGYPDCSWQLKGNLADSCPKKHPTHNQCQQCNIEFFPMMRGKYLAYQILHLKKQSS